MSPAVGLYAIGPITTCHVIFKKKTSIPTHQGVVWMEGGVERKGEIGFNEVLMFFFFNFLILFLKGERTT